MSTARILIFIAAGLSVSPGLLWLRMRVYWNDNCADGPAAIPNFDAADCGDAETVLTLSALGAAALLMPLVTFLLLRLRSLLRRPANPQ